MSVVISNNLAASEKAITSFRFNSLSPAVSGIVNESKKTISLTVPYGTNVTTLVPTIGITGKSVSPSTNVAQNFTKPVTYTVTAEDGTKQAYIVSVVKALKVIPKIIPETPIKQEEKKLPLTESPKPTDVKPKNPSIDLSEKVILPTSNQTEEQSLKEKDMLNVILSPEEPEKQKVVKRVFEYARLFLSLFSFK